MPDIYVCYLSVSATFHGFRRKTTKSVVKELVLHIYYQCSWTSDSEFEEVIRIHHLWCRYLIQ